MTEVACPGCGAPLIRDGRRLERSWVCSAPQSNQVYADCVNLSALLRCARDTLLRHRPGHDRNLRFDLNGSCPRVSVLIFFRCPSECRPPVKLHEVKGSSL